MTRALTWFLNFFIYIIFRRKCANGKDLLELDDLLFSSDDFITKQLVLKRLDAIICKK